MGAVSSAAALGLLLALAGAAFVVLLHWRTGQPLRPLGRRLGWLGVGGVVVGAAAFLGERALLAFAGLEAPVVSAFARGGWLASLSLTAPLLQGLTVGVVWPLYRLRGFREPREGLLTATAAAAAVGAGNGTAFLALEGTRDLAALRALAALAVLLSASAAWGHALGHRASRGRWFGPTWLVSTAALGLALNLVFGRVPAAMLAVVPLLAASVPLWVWALRPPPSSAARGPDAVIHSARALLDQAAIESMGRALLRQETPLALRWVVVGTLVMLGAVFTALTLAWLVGFRLGVDFSRAEQGSLGAASPLVLFAAAALAAFPVAGFLLARASRTSTLREPALSALLALVALTTVLGSVAPALVVFVVAGAPVAFALACAGAWMGVTE